MMEKLIIIDDSSAQLSLLKNFFEKNSFEVYCAKNAKMGYDMIFDVAPDLIITDALMPLIGGFKLVKMVRENKLMSKIPVILYSVISKQSAKLYLDENFGEYYFKKTENLNELLDFARDVIKKHKIDENYKTELLSAPLFNIFPKKEEQEKEELKKEKTEEKREPIEQKEEEFKIELDEEILTQKLKNAYNPALQDEKLIASFFKIMYEILDYSVCAVDIFSFDENKRKLFFDIKNIILSPIFQNVFKRRFRADEIILSKKYAPNLKTIVFEDEFPSKIEFRFFFKEKNIANVIFFSLKEGKYDEIQNSKELKDVLFNFFCIRYLKKYIPDKNDKVSQKYSNQSPQKSFLNLFELAQPRQDVCLAMTKILNYEKIEEYNTDEELDVLNLKISRSMMNLLQYGEQLYKNSDFEFSFLLFAKDKNELEEKTNLIFEKLKEIKDTNEENLEISIASSNCQINGEFNPFEVYEKISSIIEEMPKGKKILVN